MPFQRFLLGLFLCFGFLLSASSAWAQTYNFSFTASGQVQSIPISLSKTQKLVFTSVQMTPAQNGRVSAEVFGANGQMMFDLGDVNQWATYDTSTTGQFMTRIAGDEVPFLTPKFSVWKIRVPSQPALGLQLIPTRPFN